MNEQYKYIPNWYALSLEYLGLVLTYTLFPELGLGYRRTSFCKQGFRDGNLGTVVIDATYAYAHVDLVSCACMNVTTAETMSQQNSNACYLANNSVEGIVTRFKHLDRTSTKTKQHRLWKSTFKDILITESLDTDGKLAQRSGISARNLSNFFDLWASVSYLSVYYIYSIVCVHNVRGACGLGLGLGQAKAMGYTVSFRV